MCKQDTTRKLHHKPRKVSCSWSAWVSGQFLYASICLVKKRVIFITHLSICLQKSIVVIDKTATKLQTNLNNREMSLKSYGFNQQEEVTV